jgi:DNA primase catalytic subunit
MAKEIENLKAETAKLKAQLEAATAKAPAAAATTTKTAAAAAPKQVLARDPDEDKKILNIIKEKDTENQKTGLKTKKGPKKVAAKAEESEELFFGEPLKPKASSKSATKKAAKKVTEKAATKTASKSDDWSTLSMSTLKRKTVKDLSDYLSERGVEVTHDDGKPMKKAELVSAVQSLQEA